jgi:hypothetical protein
MLISVSSGYGGIIADKNHFLVLVSSVSGVITHWLSPLS